jgi:hypothetical protein
VTSALLSTLAALAPFAVVGAAPTATAVKSTPRVIHLSFQDGSSKTVQLDGVGCAESICSRIIVNSRAVGSAVVNHTRLAEIVALRNIDDGNAVVVLKDGSKRSVSVVPDNRVLYVIGADGRTQKVNLGRLKSIEFAGQQSE